MNKRLQRHYAAQAMRMYPIFKRMKMNEYFSKKVQLAISSREKQSNSFTKTKTEEEGGNSSQTNMNNVHQSVVKVYTGNSRLGRVTKNNIEYTDGYQFELSWDSNFKIYFHIASLGTRVQYIQSFTQANMVDPFNAHLFALNVNQGTTGGQLTTPVFNPTNDWIGIDNATYYYDLVNLSNLPCELTFQWWKAKTTINEPVLSTYQQATADNQLYTNPFVFPTEGVSLQSGGEAAFFTPATATDLGFLQVNAYSNLMSRSDLKNDWGLLTTRKIVLAAGEVHRMTNLIKANMFASKSTVTDSESYPKGSIQCTVACQGMGSHVNSTSPVYAGPVIAGGKVGIVVTRKVRAKTLKAPNEKYDTHYVGRGNVFYRAPVTKATIIGDIDLAIDGGERVD